MQQPEARSSGPIRVALVNDYEIVLRGLESMLRPFRDRIVVVELDVAQQPRARRSTSRCSTPTDTRSSASTASRARA